MSDVGGGAERVALDLHETYLQLGHPASLAVAQLATPGHGLVRIDNDRYRGAPARLIVSRLPQPEGAGLIVRRVGRALAEPKRALNHLCGREDFDYPATAHLPELTDRRPDLLHLHNLHGGYFDLRQLPSLTHAFPTVLTLHDTWLLSGHCAYYLDCSRWLNGCGECLHLDSPPSIARDSSAYNWKLKKEILSRSRLHVVAPSEWILAAAEKSILAPAMVSASVIRNGVDQTVFRPGDKVQARQALRIPPDRPVIVFSANGLSNPYKDFAGLIQALRIAVQDNAAADALLLAIGARDPLPGLDPDMVRVVPFTERRDVMAEHLRAADLFVHSTRADNYPLTVLEAQSCGVPAIVTDVGGTAETISDGVTGVTCAPARPDEMARVIIGLLGDRERLTRMSEQATLFAAQNHSVQMMADKYLDLYDRVIEV